MDWKSVKKIVIITAIILGLIIVFAIAAKTIESVGISITSYEDTIKRMINRKYPNYEISDLKLQYVDFYSTVREADMFNKGSMAEAVIKNDSEQRTLKFKRLLFIWIKTSDVADYGSDIPDDVYYARIDYLSLGKLVDVESYIAQNNLMIIPTKDGELYAKYGTDDDWYYSICYYRDIYRTSNGRVYKFNSSTLEWELSDVKYSDLVYYGNYTKMNDDFIKELKSRGFVTE